MDRRPGMIREWMMPVLEESDWTVTAAYISDPNNFKPAWRLMDEHTARDGWTSNPTGSQVECISLPETPLEQMQNEI